MSSILQIEREFRKLDKVHKKIKHFYNIRSLKGKKHRFIQDINDDFKEDQQIYGYNRFDIKKSDYKLAQEKKIRKSIMK